jgi:hypothetical protein
MSDTAGCNARTIDELVKIWLEVVVVWSVYCPRLSLKTQRKAKKHRTAEKSAGIPTHRLPNTSTERQCGAHRSTLL